MADERQKRLDEALASIQKKYGARAIVRGDQFPALRRIPTGIFSLDCAMGINDRQPGAPEGRITIFVGLESSCKTTLLCKGFAQAQLWGWPTALIDAEHDWDADWAVKQGVDPARLLIEPSKNAEQSLDVLAALIRAMPQGLIGVDSIAQLTPNDEIESSFYEWQQGLSARLMNKGFRAMQAGANYSASLEDDALGPTVFVCQQFRTNIKSGFDVMPGGNGQKFAASVVVKLRATHTMYHLPGSDGPVDKFEPAKKDKVVPVGQQFAFTITKNKTAPAHRSGEFTMYTTAYEDPETGVKYAPGQTDYYDQVMRLGVVHGVIKVSGSWYSIGDNRIGQGREKSGIYLQTHSDALDTVLEGIYTAEMARMGYSAPEAT